MTSIIFQVPITIVGALGILISVGGFMAFSYAKAMKSSSKVGVQRRLESSWSGSSIENESDVDVESYGGDKDRQL